MSYTNFVKKGIEFFIFTTPISLHGNYFAPKFAFNKLLEIEKDLVYFMAFFEKINPSKFTIIINKAYIVLVFANRWRRPCSVAEVKCATSAR